MGWDGWRGVLQRALGIYPTLDLHGLKVRKALEETELFVRQAYDAGVPAVRIVYGKGRGSKGGVGVLRELVPRWLEREGKEMVERYERRPDTSGMDGYAVVWLRRREENDEEELRK